jgi:hypothetical protein
VHIYIYKCTHVLTYKHLYTASLAELKAAYLRAQIEYKDTLEEHNSLLEFRELELELKNRDRNHGKEQEMVVMEDENSFDYSIYNSEVKDRKNLLSMIAKKDFRNPLSLKISKVRV